MPTRLLLAGSLALLASLGALLATRGHRERTERSGGAEAPEQAWAVEDSESGAPPETTATERISRESSSARPPPGPEERRILVGRVFDAGGRPVAAAWVELRNARDSLVDAAHTDAEGRYRLVTSRAGTYRVAVRKRGCGKGSTGPIAVGDPGLIEVPDLVLRGAGIVGGEVRFPDGAPAEGVKGTVSLDTSRGPRPPSSAP